MFPYTGIPLDDIMLLSALLMVAACIIFAIIECIHDNGLAGLALTAVIAVVCCLSRLLFWWFPHVGPMASIAFIASSVLGPIPGFLIGAGGMALASCFTFMGPFTVFQTIGMALLGAIGGMTNQHKAIHVAISSSLACFFLYGVLSNVGFLISFDPNATYGEFLQEMGTGMEPELLYAISTFIFSLVLWKPVRNVVRKCMIKYVGSTSDMNTDSASDTIPGYEMRSAYRNLNRRNRSHRRR